MVPTIDLIALVRKLADLLVAVATGGPRIDDTNAEYRQLRDLLQGELSGRGLSLKIPFSDLWEWYGRFSAGDFPTWRSRRQYIGELARLQIAEIEAKETGIGQDVEPTGWERVDRSVGTVREQLALAASEEQYQAVGLLCRETLISLGQAVYVAELHPTVDGVAASSSDAKRMLEAFIAVELNGAHNKIARQHARVAFDLANELQHRRTATFRDAAMCVEATLAVVNVVAITSGRRDP